MPLPIYLDYNATTPVAPEVLEAMLPWLGGSGFGNPSSEHEFGRHARDAVAGARSQVAALIGAQPEEIVFTGSATEANNLALLGVAAADRGHRRHLVTSAIEHPSVAAPMAHLRAQGWEVTTLPVDSHGRVDPADLAAALRADTVLVSIMHANNEIGTLQPIAELATLAHARGALFHTDAAQSVGKIAASAAGLGVDLLTMAGHKLYAPKGIGALFVRAGTPVVPILFGAGHERGLRPGTENVPHIVALGAAAALAQGRLSTGSQRLRDLRDQLHRRLAEAVPGLVLNGHPEERLPSTLNLSFPGVSGRDLLRRASTVAASLGAACHGSDDTPSGVLGAMGLTAERARGAIRLSLGEPTTEGEILRASDALAGAWRALSGS